MKFIHLSDLHIGKRVNEFSMQEEQEHILNQILTIIDEESPHAVLIAGDVYDKSIPSTEAVELLDSFLYRLSLRNTEVFIISGNHDSPERLAFASRLIDTSGIHISPVYSGTVKPYNVKGVNIYMLPFIKPSNVRRYFEDEKIETYTDALRTAVENMNIDTAQPNILVTHQFVTGSSRTESEDISVGGTDNVDAEVFDAFDYVALGHIHRPQNCRGEKIRYCGTPLKYSFSEVKDKKSVTVGELDEDKQLRLHTVPLVPLHDMAEIRGKYNELVSKSFYENTTYTEDFIHITLTDEEDIPDAVSKLRTVYHNLMKLDYDNTRTRSTGTAFDVAKTEARSPADLFAEFYSSQNGVPLNEEQSAYLENLIAEIWEV